MPKSKIIDKKIEKIFKEYMEGKLTGKKGVAIQKLMEKYGYSKNSASICQITQTRKWQQLLDGMDDEPLLKELKNIALSGDKDSDKIKAITELMKLKKRYPEQQKQSTRNLFQTQINNLMADDNDVIDIPNDKQTSED
jgi:hypothetical protein